MANRAPTLRKSDIDRSLKAVRDAGLQVVRVEIQPGASFVIHTNEAQIDPDSPLDAWRRQNGSR